MALSKKLSDLGFTLKDGLLAADDTNGCTVTLEGGVCTVTTKDGVEFRVLGVTKVDLKKMTVKGGGRVGIDLG